MAHYQEYEYRIPKKLSIFIILLFGIMGFTSIPKALHNEKPLVYKNLITLPPEMADWFWIGFTVMCLTFTAFGLYLLVKSFQEPRLVILKDNELILPKKPLSNIILTVKYSDIIALKLQVANKKNQSLFIITKNDKCVLKN